MTKFYDLNIRTLHNKDFLYDFADRERKKKALRFIREEDQLRSLGAAYLMKKYLPDYSEERIYFGKDGKPFLREGFPFSISHGGDHIVMAYDDHAKAVGVDVEPVKGMSFFRPILSSYTTEKERIFIGDDPQKAMWIWTRKESLYKCFGEGFSDFLELPDTTPDLVKFFSETVLLKSFEKDGHIFTLALREPDKNMNKITESDLSYMEVYV